MTPSNPKFCPWRTQIRFRKQKRSSTPRGPKSAQEPIRRPKEAHCRPPEAPRNGVRVRSESAECGVRVGSGEWGVAVRSAECGVECSVECGVKVWRAE